MNHQQHAIEAIGEPVGGLTETRVGSTPTFSFLPPSLSKIKVNEKEGYIPPTAGTAPKRATADDIMWTLRFLRDRRFARAVAEYPVEEMLGQIELARQYLRTVWLTGRYVRQYGVPAYRIKHDAENLGGVYRGYVSSQAVTIAAYLENVRITVHMNADGWLHPTKARRTKASPRPTSSP
jgi:hypothetical protein